MRRDGISPSGPNNLKPMQTSNTWLPAHPFSFVFTEGAEPPELAALHPPGVRQVYIASVVKPLDSKGTMSIKPAGTGRYYTLRIQDYIRLANVHADVVSAETMFAPVNLQELIYSREQPLCADTLPRRRKP
jgi:hypothetical protein